MFGIGRKVLDYSLHIFCKENDFPDEGGYLTLHVFFIGLFPLASLSPPPPSSLQQSLALCTATLSDPPPCTIAPVLCMHVHGFLSSKSNASLFRELMIILCSAAVLLNPLQLLFTFYLQNNLRLPVPPSEHSRSRCKEDRQLRRRGRGMGVSWSQLDRAETMKDFFKSAAAQHVSAQQSSSPGRCLHVHKHPAQLKEFFLLLLTFLPPLNYLPQFLDGHLLGPSCWSNQIILGKKRWILHWVIPSLIQRQEFQTDYFLRPLAPQPVWLDV